ncbi:hypothetical protein [Paracoccus sp. (in: a-proteobacteria)]|uniref:hypothetical protein n=1 Tax=Paracoccus sp. TaxID=267 RepID=UPI00321F9F90
MRDLAAELLALEGRVIAHRRVLMRLLALAPPAAQAGMLDWLEERQLMHDGQEDPGAVPAEGAALELALADELRLLHADLAARQRR